MWGIPMFGIRSKLHKQFGLYPQIKDKDGHVARFLYKTKPAVRNGWGKKPANTYFERKFKELHRLFGCGSNDTQSSLRKSVLLPVIDGGSICGMIEEFQPKRFVEFGSGNSTRFRVLYPMFCINEYRLSQMTSACPTSGSTVKALRATGTSSGAKDDERNAARWACRLRPPYSGRSAGRIDAGSSPTHP